MHLSVLTKEVHCSHQWFGRAVARQVNTGLQGISWEWMPPMRKSKFQFRYRDSRSNYLVSLKEICTRTPNGLENIIARPNVPVMTIPLKTCWYTTPTPSARALSFCPRGYPADGTDWETSQQPNGGTTVINKSGVSVAKRHTCRGGDPDLMCLARKLPESVGGACPEYHILLYAWFAAIGITGCRRD